jgi:hypothetical protein
MADQQHWIDLDERTEEIQELVMQVADLVYLGKRAPEIVYQDSNWGLTGNPILCSALLQMKTSGKVLSHDQILSERGAYSKDPSGSYGIQEEIEDNINYRRKPESIITKDITWFIQNGETEEIRLRAREYREKALLDLYLEHVKQTGETYFPQLQQLLEAEWKFRLHGNEDD